MLIDFINIFAPVKNGWLSSPLFSDIPSPINPDFQICYCINT